MMLYGTEMNTLSWRAVWRAWLLTKLNVPVKIIGGGGGGGAGPPGPSPCYGTDSLLMLLLSTFNQYTKSSCRVMKKISHNFFSGNMKHNGDCSRKKHWNLKMLGQLCHVSIHIHPCHPLQPMRGNSFSA